ncbi:Bcd1p NDAI_0C04040 [Naumovozyma dairenensis CBS 421]|uniref:HIT-type domain-containing protein n=1 Tax=Naumovozyma dairenensis (strain ATCC 10597 / BCRC 20456 / CBS 421 / NBRC 0211 / NRRL Y-12639) TaxID=1071378 RepID=G0W8F3_NAUDC|nr:hypothetical protein NDAI_0C04040 [Naumovozyma dairenensis CBS 421]CCD24064.1 hypothetical protein NDAI_0C04040 [Naumovozyma dairenensis CBS 421]
MSSKCEICHEIEFKYKCPKCLKKTCSLKCSQAHKKDDNCSGIAHDPTVYIPHDTLKEADDENHESNVLVQRDFNYLTNLKRVVELQKVDGKTKNKRTLQSFNNNNTNKRARFNNGPVSESNRVVRRGVNCLLLPRGMQRSVQNRSKWDKPLDVFVWSIEWIICSVGKNDQSKEDTSNNLSKEKSVVKYVSHRFKETDSIVGGMSNIVFEKCCNEFGIPTPEKGSNTPDVDKAAIIKENNWKFYIKWFPYNNTMVMDSKNLIQIDASEKCIGEILRDKTVIEYPTIFISQTEANLPNDFTVIEEPKYEERTRTFGSESTVSSSNENRKHITKKLNIQVNDADDNEPPEEEAIRIGHKNTENDVAKEKKSIIAPVSDEDSDDYEPGLNIDFLAS